MLLEKLLRMDEDKLRYIFMAEKFVELEAVLGIDTGEIGTCVREDSGNHSLFKDAATAKLNCILRCEIPCCILDS
jgi:hypothetical protein